MPACPATAPGRDWRAVTPQGEPIAPALLSAIVEQASDGFFVTDADLRIEWVNETACALLRLDRSQIVGRRIPDLFDPSAPSDEPIHREELVAGRPTMTLRTFRTGDGQARVLEVSAKSIGGGRLLGIARDATERLAAQERLVRSEASFRTLIEGFPDCVVVHREGKVVYVNAAGARLFGAASPAELVGASVLDVVHADDRAHVDGRLGELFSGAATTPFTDVRLVRRDGAAVIAAVSGLRVIFEGQPSFVAVARDVTAQRQWQQQQAQTDRLAMLGTLAAGVAHEINNPLAYVILNLDAIARRAGQDDSSARKAIAEHAALALEGAHRVAGIVHDLKALSRDEDDKRTHTDVRRGIELAVSTVSHLLRQRARVVLDPFESASVLASEGRLAQIFINLLVNAAQAIPEGHADANEIRVTTSVDAAEVRVAVRDTGTGIGAAHRPLIFEPFFTTKAAGEGSGLGLAICQNLVQALGGRILVDSRPGEGSTFAVILPRAREATSPPPRDTNRDLQ